MPIDIHSQEFDEGTQIKLSILREYLRKWIPVFITKRTPIWKKIFIYDFFAGEGADAVGNYGSPLIILDELRKYCQEISSKLLYVKVVFNEFNFKKTERLTRICDEFLSGCRYGTNGQIACPSATSGDPCVFRLTIENSDFQDFFSSVYSNMEKHPEFPRFMFLDQYGVKHVTEEIFGKLVSLDRTDFIFFISSSFVHRFAENPEFQNYLNLSREEFDQLKPYQCHRVIYEYYKTLLPNYKQFYVAPFSIKKGANVYGLIFGTNHKLGIEKFLNVCWNLNDQTGDANFDIDNEHINPSLPKLFPDQDTPSKLQFFERRLKEQIENDEIKTNQEVYDLTFDMGMLPKHANKVCRELQNEKRILLDVPLSSQNIHRLEERSLKHE